jgi:hypothetical protein
MAPNIKVKTAPTKANEVAIAQAEAPKLEYVNWRKDPGLRKLYLYAAVICVASATTGYDGYGFSFLPYLAHLTTTGPC